MRILWISDSPLISSSYAKITHELCKRLGKDFEVHILASFFYGKPLKGENYFIHSYEDEKNLHYLINMLKPDYVIWLSDLLAMKDILRVNLNDSKFIPYFPSDGFPLVYGGEQILKIAHKRIAVSKYTQQIAKEQGFDSEVLYHGVDTNIFRPIEVNKENFGIDNDRFVFLSLGTNSGRKMFWRLIRCFNEFIKTGREATLIIRTIPDKEFNLIEFTRYRYPELFTKKRLIFSVGNMFQPAPDGFINEFYNIADVFITTTSGEGFGLPYIESMACKKPIITPNFSTTQELILDEFDDIGPRGIGTKIDTYASEMQFFVDHGICSVEDTVNSMIKLYENEKLRKEFGENGLKFVKKFCNWDKITEQLKAILKL